MARLWHVFYDVFRRRAYAASGRRHSRDISERRHRQRGSGFLLGWRLFLTQKNDLPPHNNS